MGRAAAKKNDRSKILGLPVRARRRNQYVILISSNALNAIRSPPVFRHNGPYLFSLGFRDIASPDLAIAIPDRGLVNSRGRHTYECGRMAPGDSR